MSPARTSWPNAGTEKKQVAETTRLRHLDGTEVRGLEMEPIADHELHVIFVTREDHCLAVLLVHRHRLLTEHVDAGPGAALGERTMLRIG